MARLFGISKDEIVARFDGLSDRERKLSFLMMGVALVIVVGGGSYWLFSHAMETKDNIVALKKEIADISKLEPDYLEAKEKQARFARLFKNNNVVLPSLIQNSASIADVTPSELNEERAPLGKSGLIELNVTVSLKQISIDRLTKFLETIEDPKFNGIVKIKRLNVKTRTDTPELLDVSMTVATWKSV